MRVGIIGFGRAGQVHHDAWALVPGAHVVAVCDTSRAVRQQARGSGITAHGTVASLLAHELDAVSICTPPDVHADLAIACLNRGLHVLCEKPLALSPWDAQRMLQCASRKRRHLLLATKFRHVPDLERARALVRDGAVGDVVAFEISFCSAVEMAHRWNSHRERAGGGVIIDNGCHAFDIAAFLIGSLSRVQATLLKSLQGITVEDSATIQVRTDNGAVGRIDLSWSLAMERDAYVVVHGSRGTIEIGWKTSRFKCRGGAWQPIDGPYDKREAHRRMNAHFLRVVAGEESPWISAAEALRTVAAVDAAYRSVRSAAWEEVDPLPQGEPSTGTWGLQ